MNSPARPVPQPVPLDAANPGEVMQLPERPPPSTLRVVMLTPESETELGFVYKRTYDLDATGRPVSLSDEQPPLDEEGSLHEPLEPGALPSFRSLPEVVAFKTGTDVVIRAAARPPRPVAEWSVEARVGPWVHAAHVSGPRQAEWRNGHIRFTPPAPFETMPLRMENAYGGRDFHSESALLQEVQSLTSAESLRRARPSLEGIFGENHPLMYPRNRFGKGYVLRATAEAVHGRELPCVERPDDRLTPERLLASELAWSAQPLPASFDYLDPFSFPRSAMLGMPPAADPPVADDVAEVRMGLIPAGYCLGNLLLTQPQEMWRCIHPWASRCAQPGLCLPFLKGDEWIVLSGMDAHIAELQIPLPRERPELTLPSWLSSPRVLTGVLNLVFLDVDARRLSLIWSARGVLRRTVLPSQLPEIEATSALRMIEVQ